MLTDKITRLDELGLVAEHGEESSIQTAHLLVSGVNASCKL